MTLAALCRSWAHVRGLALGQHSSEEMSRWWRAVGETVFDLTGREIEPQAFRPNSVRLITELTGRLCSTLASKLAG